MTTDAWRRTPNSPTSPNSLTGPGPVPGPAPGRARLTWLLAALLALIPAVASSFDAGVLPRDGTLGPGAVFESVETAVVDALAHAHNRRGPRHQGRIRLGTIHRVANGFSYRAPIESEETVWAARAPSVRFRLRVIDVATYVIHPRSGHSRIDRQSEQPNESERRIVDELDPRARPLYLLTPSKRVLRYGREAGADRGNLVELGAPARPVPEVAVNRSALE